MDSMTRSAVGIAATLTIVWNAALTATESDATAVRIRVVDYAGITNDVIAHAQQRVCDIYQIIGMRIQWQITRPLERSSSVANNVTEPSEFVIIVLSPDMSRHLPIAPDALGMAIVSPQGGGRIAYVLFDRVMRVARAARSDVTDILGVVIAHEIGHLLLPQGSHSDNGLMRPDWNIHELRRPRQPAFEFTLPQEEAIRHRLQRGAPVSSANDPQ